MEIFPLNGKLTASIYGFNKYTYLSILTPDNCIAYDLTVCKEYILDYAMFSITGHKNIYCTKTKIHLDEVRIVIFGMDEIINSLEFVNLFEKALNIPLTIINRLSDGNKTAALFRGNKLWFLSPPMLSLYALLIRSGKFHTLGETIQQTLDKFYPPWPSNYAPTMDHSNHNEAKKGISCLLKHGYKKVFGTNMKANWEQIPLAHTSGIASFSQGLLKPHKPNWYECLE